MVQLVSPGPVPGSGSAGPGPWVPRPGYQGRVRVPGFFTRFGGRDFPYILQIGSLNRSQKGSLFFQGVCLTHIILTQGACGGRIRAAVLDTTLPGLAGIGGIGGRILEG